MQSAVCYKMLASQVLLKVSKELEITEAWITNWTYMTEYSTTAENYGPLSPQS
jgi:hypothetical protein